MRFYELEVGYNGADITDVAVKLKVEEHRANWLVSILQSGLDKEGVLSGFVNVVGLDGRRSYTRHKLIERDCELPTPFED